MFRFIKKMVVLGAVVGIGAYIAFGTGVGNVIRTGYKQVKDRVESSIPTEFEIHRIEDLIDQIGPELGAVEHQVAEEQVAIRELENKIAALRTMRTGKTQEIKVIRASLDGSPGRVRLGDLVYSRDHVEVDLARRLDELKADESLIDSNQRLLVARRGALDAAKTRMLTFNAERTRLKAMVQTLRAQLAEQQTLAANCIDVNLDDSKLAQARELAARVQRKLEVNRVKIANRLGAPAAVEVPAVKVEPTATRDVLAEVDEYLDASDAPRVAVAPALEVR